MREARTGREVSTFGCISQCFVTKEKHKGFCRRSFFLVGTNRQHQLLRRGGFFWLTGSQIFSLCSAGLNIKTAEWKGLSEKSGSRHGDRAAEREGRSHGGRHTPQQLPPH